MIPGFFSPLPVPDGKFQDFSINFTMDLPLSMNITLS